MTPEQNNVTLLTQTGALQPDTYLYRVITTQWTENYQIERRAAGSDNSWEVINAEEVPRAVLIHLLGMSVRTLHLYTSKEKEDVSDVNAVCKQLCDFEGAVNAAVGEVNMSTLAVSVRLANIEKELANIAQKSTSMNLAVEEIAHCVISFCNQHGNITNVLRDVLWDQTKVIKDIWEKLSEKKEQHEQH